MSFFENAGLKLLRLSNPEFAHNIAIKALNLRLVPKPQTLVFENLKTSVCGLKFDNPIGLAAGFDKNAEAVDSCLLYTSPSPRDGLLSRMPSSA